MAITVKGLAGLAAGAWLTDDGERGAGNLRAKGSAKGARFYFRYRDSDKQYDDYPLGVYDEKGRDGLTLAQARQKAGALSLRYQAGERDLRIALETEEREAARVREAALRAAEVDRARQEATLGALLDAYVSDLRRQGKASAAAVERSLKRHVKEPWPQLTNIPADEVTGDDLLEVVARLADADKLREAGKLRTYLQAAYNAGIRARQSAGSSPALRALKVTTNPARDLLTVAGGSTPKDRALSEAELQHYWKRIAALPDHEGAALRFHLLTGGQRMEQLGRATTSDLDLDAQAVRLWDTKGRRTTPRKHMVPLIPAALDALRQMAPERVGNFLFTVTAGASGADPGTLRKRLLPVVFAMQEAGELPGGPFTVGDLRRTIETRLAALGVSLEVRGQLQSHGLGGVQARHYDRHDYLQEKRDALIALYALMRGSRPGSIPREKKKRA